MRNPPGWLRRDRVYDFMVPKPSRDELVDTNHGYILYMEDVSVSFDGLLALDNLTLYVDAGEPRRIIGPNSAGNALSASKRPLPSLR